MLGNETTSGVFFTVNSLLTQLPLQQLLAMHTKAMTESWSCIHTRLYQATNTVNRLNILT